MVVDASRCGFAGQAPEDMWTSAARAAFAGSGSEITTFKGQKAGTGARPPAPAIACIGWHPSASLTKKSSKVRPLGGTAKIAAASLAGVLLIGGALVFMPRAHPDGPTHIDFNRDIRPIFNSQCITCHGGVKQAAGVSFSYRDQALGKGKSGRPIVVPGSPGASELIARVTSHDPEVRMPLHGTALSSHQIALLRQWIKEGAAWQNYWAFVPPKPQDLPAVKQASWVRQPLDRFILARLEKEKLSPAPEADKAELLRRVSLDLTGMPPTPEEQTAFLADTSPNAYEKQVDRLLASP